MPTFENVTGYIRIYQRVSAIGIQVLSSSATGVSNHAVPVSQTVTLTS